jgi:hypothetical protein
MTLHQFHPGVYNCRYPIYRIPTGPTLKDLDACFLTFHYLSTPSKGMFHLLLVSSLFLHQISSLILCCGVSFPFFSSFDLIAIPFPDTDPSTPPCPNLGGLNCNMNAAGKLTLPVFGLASYKLKSSIWSSNRPEEQQLAASLTQTADDWLRHRQVYHPDFRFFLTHFNTALR